MSSLNTFSSIQFIGTQRSGSNLLRVMLNQLPEITAPHPPHILKTFFPLLGQYGDLDIADNFFTLVKDVCDWVNVNPVAWDGIYFEPETVVTACKHKTLIEIFRRIYELKASADGTRFWCCKSMESVQYVSDLEKSGIHPYYIHIYRDGRDVALSFLKAIVGPKHIYHLAKKWEEEQRLSLALKESISPNRFISVKYEDLLDHPVGVMKVICNTLNLEYRDTVMDYFHSKESYNTSHSGAMWKNVAKPILKNNHHKYLKELSTEDLQIFEFVAGDMLTQLGYNRVTDTSTFDITAADVIRFNQLNQEKIKQALLLAEVDDVERRRPQEELLQSIKSRVG